MAYRRRIFFTDKQKSEIWDRWQRGLPKGTRRSPSVAKWERLGMWLMPLFSLRRTKHGLSLVRFFQSMEGSF